MLKDTNSKVVIGGQNALVKAAIEILLLIQGLFFMGFCVYFLIRAGTWEKGFSTLLSNDVTPWVVSDDSMSFIPLGPQRSHFYIEKCDHNEKLEGRQVSYCKISGFPKVFSTLNVEGSIWPGRSMDINYLLYAYCIIHVIFNTSYLPFNLFLPKEKYTKIIFQRVVVPKIVLIVFLFIFFITMSVIFILFWGTEFCSIAIGVFFVSVTMAYSVEILKKEETETVSVFRKSLEIGSSVRFYLARQCCTLPVLMYIIFFQVNSFCADYTFNVIMILASMTYLSFLFLENRIVYLIERADEISKQKMIKFRTQKMIHFCITCIITGTFFAYLLWSTNFIDRVKMKFTSPTSERYANMVYVIYKMSEAFLFVLSYFCDQIDMTYIKSSFGNNSKKYDSKTQPIQLLRRTSLIKFTLFTAVDSIFALYYIFSVVL